MSRSSKGPMKFHLIKGTLNLLEHLFYIISFVKGFQGAYYFRCQPTVSFLLVNKIHTALRFW